MGHGGVRWLTTGIILSVWIFLEVQTWKKVKEQGSVVWMCSKKVDMRCIYRVQG